MNRSATPSDAESAALSAMREELGSDVSSAPPELSHEYGLLRFIRGHGCDGAKAAAAFRETLAFREKHGLDALRAEIIAAGPGDGVPAWPTEALPRFAPLMEVLDGGKGWSTRRGEDAAGNMMNVVLMHKYDLKKVLAADLEQLILEGQRALDEYWLIELHRLSLERKSLVARHEVIFVQEMSMLHFDISSLRLLPKLSEGSKMYPEQVALMSSVGNGAVLLALYRRIIRPFTPAHTREKLAVHGKVDSIDEWLQQAEAGTVETQMSEDA